MAGRVRACGLAPRRLLAVITAFFSLRLLRRGQGWRFFAYRRLPHRRGSHDRALSQPWRACATFLVRPHAHCSAAADAFWPSRLELVDFLRCFFYGISKLWLQPFVVIDLVLIEESHAGRFVLFRGAACFAVLWPQRRLVCASGTARGNREISPSPPRRAALFGGVCRQLKILQENSGNAPQVAVVIGVVLILIGAWNLVNVLVPAAAISSLIDFIRHLWNVVWPCGLLAAGGYLLWATKIWKAVGLCAAWQPWAFRRSRRQAHLRRCGGIAYYLRRRRYGGSHYRGYSARRISPMATVAYLVIALFVPQV